MHDPHHRIGYLVALYLCALTVAGCGPSGVQTSKETQSNVLETMVFERHQTAGCVGMVSFPVHGGTVVSFMPAPDTACKPAEISEGSMMRPFVTTPILTWSEGMKQVTVSRAFPVDGLICIERSTGEPLCGLVREWERWGATR